MAYGKIKMGKKSDDEKKKFKKRAEQVIGPATPRSVAGNKEGRASEFYKASRPIDFLMNMFPEIPGKPGKVKMPDPGGRVISAQKKRVPPKKLGGR